MYKYKFQKFRYKYKCFELTNGCPKGSINKIHECIMIFHPVTYKQKYTYAYISCTYAYYMLHIRQYILDGIMYTFYIVVNR